MSYLLQTEKGTTPPKYVHQTLQSAITEAKRLSSTLNQDVKILELVGVVSTKEVPVVEVKTTVELIERLKDDLPF